ncbi:hypothetical protein BVG19_g4716 [[Candida] boidinii]|nr:hypothetical protein BVG19_g4716 [[Candida] boidinii]OWB52215.1 hypothetical protein B5S27_g3787 [[Candida] boidinii]OWB86913.1 hypothetical protein B5S33_g5637 [[Candida] boidinii]
MIRFNTCSNCRQIRYTIKNLHSNNTYNLNNLTTSPNTLRSINNINHINSIRTIVIASKNRKKNPIKNSTDSITYNNNNNTNENFDLTIPNNGNRHSRNNKNHTKLKNYGNTDKYEESLTNQLKKIQDFTLKVNNVILNRKDQIKSEEIKMELDIKQDNIDHDLEYDDQLEKDADAIFKNLMLEDNSLNNPGNLLSLGSTEPLQIENGNKETEESTSISLFPNPKPYITLPASIRFRLGESTKYIMNKETADYSKILKYLQENDGFKGIQDSNDIIEFIKLIPRNQIKYLINDYYKLIEDSNIKLSTYGYNTIISKLNYNLNFRNTKNLELIENLYETHLANSNENKKINIMTCGIMINTYSKIGDLNKIKFFLNLLNANGLKPSLVIYTSILQCYIRLNKYKQACDIFDTMKFESIETSPSAKTYNSIILMDILNNNIEKALSRYDEMEQSSTRTGLELKPERETLLALARGCSTRTELLLKGWRFIIEYYRLKYPIENLVLEIMIQLAKSDGDLNFARALYLNMNDLKSKTTNKFEIPSGTALKLLFNSYVTSSEDYKLKKNQYEEDDVGTDKGEQIALLSDIDDEVHAIKLKSLELINFEPIFNDRLPILPFDTINTKDDKLILAESSAIFNYHLLKYPNILTSEIIEAYLFVYAYRCENIQQFKQIFNKITYLDRGDDINPENGLIGEQEENITIEEPEFYEQAQEDEAVTGNIQRLPEFTRIAQGLEFKFPRDDRIYNSCMHAARRFKDLKFSQEIWMERGLYRKTQNFQNLSKLKQDELDFKFARSMLSNFVITGAITDAYQLVLSSQSRFIWTYYHLKSLIELCTQLGYNKFVDELKIVIKKSNRYLK